MYNTVLGSRALEPDGRAFYYSDYNRKGQRVYSNHIWPCCSGTLPQIAADYRISSYFRDGRDVFVNLYLSSTLRWMVGGMSVSLTQTTEYPMEETVRMKLALNQSAKFALSLRIPGWAEGASVSINGKQVSGLVPVGSFLCVERKWNNGDEIALTLPMSLSLEAISPQHPDTVARMKGPMVLFAVGDRQLALTAKQNARREARGALALAGREWLGSGEVQPVHRDRRRAISHLSANRGMSSFRLPQVEVLCAASSDGE